ncbi:hydroxyacid dehydrogenase [Halomonas salipaludis]|uniref:Hydroxyacid dehydrogenase n=1 Tax=Halomonas salipaludis TaxID=2032625 RepID=A0A2A2EVC0_9GAMM|nr:hydroxyacid dehydrogenase [Halomonas salipaludis]PAU76510.1 hydroxyacid dehydrogenase [Halomonas salipaludis]
MSYTVLITAPRLAEDGLEVLEQAGCRLLFIPLGEEDLLVDIMSSQPIDAVIARTLPIGREAITACQGLRVISRHGVGHDAVDIQAAAERNIPVTVVGSTNAQSVAELAIGLMLAVARDIPTLSERVRAGEWPRQAPGMQLSGRTLGLVGYGVIARHVARMSSAIGMHVMAYDPAVGEMHDGVRQAASLMELLAASDVVSLHCPLLPETRHLMDTTALAALRPGAIVINTARGGLVDEDALAESIASGHLRGAGLDTLAEEPAHPGHRLLQMPQVVIMPHVGGNSDAALAWTARAAAENALAMLVGQRPAHGRIVNEDLLEATP